MRAWVLEGDGEGSSALSDLQIALAQTLLMLGKFEESELLARASLALREKRFAADTYQVQSARATLGSALVGQKRYAEAEPLLAAGCEFFKRRGVSGQASLNNIQITNRVTSLVQLYEVTGRPEQAADWKKPLAGMADGATAPSRPKQPE